MGITPSPLKDVKVGQVNDSSVRCVVNVTLRNVDRGSVRPPLIVRIKMWSKARVKMRVKVRVRVRIKVRVRVRINVRAITGFHGRMPEVSVIMRI